MTDFTVSIPKGRAMAIWFITGVSSGFGRALGEVLLEGGHTVVGTVRSEKDKASFEKLAPGRAVAVLMDVTDENAVRQGIADVESKVGPIAVLVNNAGYGFEGAIEEAPLDEVRRQFEVNVFGPIAVMKAVLPFMRKRRAGHIVNITSMGGLTAFPGVGIYNGSKYALEGISESLAKEVKHLGIKVTIVEPGSFRTDWAGRSLAHAPEHIADYAESVGVFRASLVERNGRQAGDPRKAALAIIKAVEANEPPLHLLLGHDALNFVGAKLGALQTEIMKWAPVSAGTNFDS
jgi:NAD(P)-dependent dehydrogenase (short-subunit alcohol dehydrogenase family)